MNCPFEKKKTSTPKILEEILNNKTNQEQEIKEYITTYLTTPGNKINTIFEKDILKPIKETRHQIPTNLPVYQEQVINTIKNEREENFTTLYLIKEHELLTKEKTLEAITKGTQQLNKKLKRIYKNL